MSDATPAYRGYRLQTLYTLDRILSEESNEGLVFKPEGAEDFDIRNMDGRLLKAVQVKAFSSNLVLSSFSPAKENSFLYRANDLLYTHDGVEIEVVSFGNVGPELQKATSENGIERQVMAKKISSYGVLSELDAVKLLDCLRFVSISELVVKERIFSALQSLSTGIDAAPAFDMLNFWLYLCAEKKQEITRNSLIQKINDVGQFIAEREAYHSEWFRSIVPIRESEITAQSEKELSNEFYNGISARYEHILANVDKPRISKLSEIRKGFEESQVVIVHGASGQGKTTIGYRYMHTFFPDQWRFQVRLIENRQQAVNIATALSGHAKAIDIPIVIYLDVAPNDIGWEELIKQLSSHKNIQILITVREEDFRRARISGAEIQFTEVDLQFDRAEAKEIYQSLSTAQTPDRFLDFEDAWNRFGNSGPLMEFVYLITQGDSLRERLHQQVRRIQDEVRSGKYSQEELDFLRLVSVASAFEARLKLRELVQHLRLASPQRTLELLEKEYLLRRNEDSTLVGGLHPVRSTILADILTDPVFTPWAESASICLPFIFDHDTGSFLLYAFSRQHHDIEPLLSALNLYKPTGWITIAGILKALIWLGIKEYAEANRNIIEEIDKDCSQAWTIFLDLDVAESMPGVTEQSLSNVMPLISKDRQRWVNDLRSRQTDKADVFIRVAEWFGSLSHEINLPKSELDWSGMSEVLFWVGRLDVSLPVSEWLERPDLNAVVENLPLEILADLAFGLFYSSQKDYHSWMIENRDNILNRFRKETQSLAWEDDGRNLRTHFLIKPFQSEDALSEKQSEKDETNREFLNAAMTRLQLLRRFFPDYECYGSRGYGHQIWINAELPDDTKKDISAHNLPIQSLVKVNSVLRALGEHSLRPATWEIYAQSVIELRRQTLKILRQLSQRLDEHFKKEKTDKALGKYACSDEWKQVRHLLETAPRLPRCAFDEWGFFSDSNETKSGPSQSIPDPNQNLAFEKYRAYTKAFNEYVRTLSNFFNQAERVLIFNPELKGGNPEKATEVAQNSGIDRMSQVRLSVLNLGDALEVLHALQIEFRRLLSKFVECSELDSLERLELEVFAPFWKLWYFFAFHPTRCFGRASQECVVLFNKKVKEVRKSIKNELKSASSDTLRIEILSETIQWDDIPTLWLKIDGDSVVNVYENIKATVTAIKKAIKSVHANDLRRYSIKFTWPSIVILLLVKGKPLEVKAIKFPSDLIAVDPDCEIKWWNFMPTDIPEKSFDQLALKPWKHPRFAAAEELRDSMPHLVLLSAHVKDFERLPDSDDIGNELLQAYVNELNSLLCEAFQSTLDKMSGLLSYFTQLSDVQKSNRQHLILAIAALGRMHEQVLPQESCVKDGNIELTMNFEDICKWSEQLDLAQSLVSAVYLYWVSDVIEEMQISEVDTYSHN
jgi:hypothetical protein